MLQLLFVLGVISAMWGEVWLLNGALLWLWGTLKISGPVLMASQSFSDTKVLALFSAYMSFISLAFVITSVHVLRFFVRRSRPTFGRTGYVKRLIIPKNQCEGSQQTTDGVRGSDPCTWIIASILPLIR